MKRQLHLNGGGKEITLPSGDKGTMIKFTLEHLNRLIEENPDVKRPWVSSAGQEGTDIVMFVMPSNKQRGKFTHYVSLIAPTEKP